MELPIIKFALLITITLAISSADDNKDSTSTENKTKVLSRKKRFLTFPDGSSFQLVFCTQTHGYLQIGDIVWFGNTAALAWELPSDPTLFHVFKSHEKDYSAQRRQDSKHVVYLDENGRVISSVPYRRKPIVNPAFAKRSIDSSEESSEIRTISIKELHEMQNNSSFLDGLNEASLVFHREGRKSLYDKLETFFKALGMRGKECVLRLLCENGKPTQNQGSFLEEILRATFTMPRFQSESELMKDYDTAHQSGGNCAELYPQCKDYRE